MASKTLTRSLIFNTIFGTRTGKGRNEKHPNSPQSERDDCGSYCVLRAFAVGAVRWCGKTTTGEVPWSLKKQIGIGVLVQVTLGGSLGASKSEDEMKNIKEGFTRHPPLLDGPRGLASKSSQKWSMIRSVFNSTRGRPSPSSDN